jgi:hypothetical protein
VFFDALHFYLSQSIPLSLGDFLTEFFDFRSAGSENVGVNLRQKWFWAAA